MSQTENENDNDNEVSIALTAFNLLLFIAMIDLLIRGAASNYIYAANLFFLVFSGYMFVSGTRSAFKAILNKLSAIEAQLQNKQ